jgi:HK97 gp10 family phage protein
MTTTHEKNALNISAERLTKLLKDFPERLQRDIINAAAAAGANEVKKAAKQNIKANGSFKTGRLYESIRSKKKRGVHGVYQVFSDKTAGYSHLVEFGTGPRKLDKPKDVKIGKNWVTITHTGTMPAKPFFRPALDENHKRVMQAIANRLAKRMAKEAGKMAQDYRTLSKSYRKKIAK